MNIKSNFKIKKENRGFIVENIKQAKQYLNSNKISKEDFDIIVKSDPTKQKKYTGWMAKIWMQDKPDIDDLRNTIEEFDSFLQRGKVKYKDINQYKNFEELSSDIEQRNNSGENVSVKDLENDYDIILDDNNLLIASPHTHEASRKLGLSKFNYRNCGEDSAWCTTYKAPNHFNDYYYTHNVTFYYIKVKSQELINKLKEAFPNKYEQMTVVALAILENGKIDGYDGLDKQISEKDINTFNSIVGIE